MVEPSQASVCEQSNLSWGDAPGKLANAGGEDKGSIPTAIFEINWRLETMERRNNG